MKSNKYYKLREMIYGYGKNDIVLYRGLQPRTMDLLKTEARKLCEDQVDLYDK